MRLSPHYTSRIMISVVLLDIGAAGTQADKQEWMDLSRGKNFEGWRKPTGEWFIAGSVGLDPKKSEQLFDAFYTTKPGGLGLGLSISRSIIENHGGRLWVERNDGSGSIFLFTLPSSEPT